MMTIDDEGEGGVLADDDVIIKSWIFANFSQNLLIFVKIYYFFKNITKSEG